ncbi:unnamed protein product [Lactuca virosa]|uniref:Glutamate receptor n=1 Tax=Lactuca virosa TaxID=75947 RepID=A0AAU9MX73_9ASTR|nr:unnamed protein product [Lactuca virosa]
MKNITHPLRLSLFVAIILLLVGVAYPYPMESMNLEANKITKSSKSNNVIQVDIGLLLDSSWKSKVLLKSFIEMAHSDFYATHSMYTTRLYLRTLYSNNAIDAVSGVVELLKDQVKAIIGPKNLVEAIFITELGEKSHVPIISFDSASYSHLHIQKPYLIRNSVTDSFLAPTIALIKEFKWNKIAFIYEDGMFDTCIFSTLRDSFQRDGIHMSYMSIIPSNATNHQISNELGKLNQLETTVFVVHMRHLLGSRFFKHAKGLGMMIKGYAWVITDVLANSLHLIDSTLMNSFDGVLGIRPHAPSSRVLENFTRRWQEHSHVINTSSLTTHEISVYGSWAYDTIWALATGIEGVRNKELSFVKEKNNKNGGEISQLGISRVGPQLLKVINNKRIQGLSAKLFLSRKERDQLANYQIFNLDGGQRIVGYWSKDKGICRELDSNDRLENSTSVESLKKIIWPGETTNIPVGWMLLKSGKKLRVAVPKKRGFTQFVKVKRNNNTNDTEVTGFCIDLFEEALKLLPFEVVPEYFPFMNSSGQSSGTYDELLSQLQSKTVDAVIGDTTIVYNRTTFVDFTLPYSEPGIVMLVPIKDDKLRGIWVFIRPLKWDLWCTIAGACLFVGLAIHVLERNGDRPWKFGLFFCFPILILAFPERKIVYNNWSRFVLVIWLFMAYIIMQGSFAKDILTRKLKYEESQLREYQTMEEYAFALKNGCQNDGVDAIFDEIPNIRLFMHTYGPKYMMVGQTFPTDGFGFAFPLGSPLVPYMSRAILNITESDMMRDLKEKHFGDKYSSQDFNPQISPEAPGLNAYNFAGLFIVTAFATMIALLCSESSFGKKCAFKLKDYEKKQGSSFSSNKVVALDDCDIVSVSGVSTNIILPTHIHQDDANANAHAPPYVDADEDSIYEEV